MAERPVGKPMEVLAGTPVARVSVRMVSPDDSTTRGLKQWTPGPRPASDEKESCWAGNGGACSLLAVPAAAAAVERLAPPKRGPCEEGTSMTTFFIVRTSAGVGFITLDSFQHSLEERSQHSCPVLKLETAD